MSMHQGSTVLVMTVAASTLAINMNPAYSIYTRQPGQKSNDILGPSFSSGRRTFGPF